MNKFTLGNFVKNESVKPKTTSDYPEWVKKSTPKIQQAYQISLREESKIKSRIISGEAITAKARKVIPSKIAEKVGVDRSYFVKKKQPDLYSHFQKVNERLKSYYIENKPRSDSSTTETKQTLKKELIRYKRLYKEERDKNISELISGMMESEMYGRSKHIAQKAADFEIENEKLRKTISTLRSRLRALTMKEVK